MLNIVEGKRFRLVSARTLPRSFRLLAGLVIVSLSVLLIASPDARGQAVNATLLGTVTDITGTVVAGFPPDFRGGAHSAAAGRALIVRNFNEWGGP